MAGDPLRFGILSTARINTSLLTAAAAVEDVEFVAVASRDGERARAYAERHGIARAYGSYEELLEDPQLDAVYVPLPNDMHAAWTLRALEAGKHVLCEKPTTRTGAQAEALVEVAERSGLGLHEAFMYQHLPLMAELRRLVAAGAIGPLRTIVCRFGFTLPEPESDLRGSAEREGGALADIGCYCVHAIRSLAGEPERVFAEAVEGWGGVDMRCCATLRIGDVLATFDVALDVPRRNGLEVVGADGALRIEDPWHGSRPEIEVVRDLDADRITVAVADPYRLELEHVAASMADGFDAAAARDLVGQARTVEALRASMTANRPVTLTPQGRVRDANEI